MKNLTKRAYIKLIETYVLYGYDISKLLNPTYKNIDAQKCLDVVNKLYLEHEGEQTCEFKLTLENI